MVRGKVQADETWVGPRLRGQGSGLKTDNKTPVMALVQRDGPMRVRVLPAVLREALDDMVDASATLMTDGLQADKKLGRHFRDHQTLDQTKGEYARGDCHVNSAEAYLALLKRWRQRGSSPRLP